MATSVEVAEDGEYRCVGGEFTLSTFLKFMSGYDPERASHVGYVGDVPMYEVWDEQYSEHDVLRALVAEVRRLRSECESLRGELPVELDEDSGWIDRDGNFWSYDDINTWQWWVRPPGCDAVAAIPLAKHGPFVRGRWDYDVNRPVAL